MFFENTGKVRSYDFACHVYHIAESKSMGDAVTDDNRAIDAEDSCAAKCFEIEFVEEGVGEAFLAP